MIKHTLHANHHQSLSHPYNYFALRYTFLSPPVKVQNISSHISLSTNCSNSNLSAFSLSYLNHTSLLIYPIHLPSDLARRGTPDLDRQIQLLFLISHNTSYSYKIFITYTSPNTLTIYTTKSYPPLNLLNNPVLPITLRYLPSLYHLLPITLFHNPPLCVDSIRHLYYLSSQSPSNALHTNLLYQHNCSANTKSTFITTLTSYTINLLIPKTLTSSLTT